MPLKKASYYQHQYQQVPENELRAIAERLAEVSERLESIATALNKLTNVVATYLETLATIQTQHQTTNQATATVPKKRMSAMDILAKEKIVFASDLAKTGKIRNIKKFIDSMKRRGAVVFDSENDVAIVDADFARELINEIKGFAGSEEDLVRHLINKFGDNLAEKIRRLVTLLRLATYIYMAPQGVWRFSVEIFTEKEKQE